MDWDPVAFLSMSYLQIKKNLELCCALTVAISGPPHCSVTFTTNLQSQKCNFEESKLLFSAAMLVKGVLVKWLIHPLFRLMHCSSYCK